MIHDVIRVSHTKHYNLEVENKKYLQFIKSAHYFYIIHTHIALNYKTFVSWSSLFIGNMLNILVNNIVLLLSTILFHNFPSFKQFNNLILCHLIK